LAVSRLVLQMRELFSRRRVFDDDWHLAVDVNIQRSIGKLWGRLDKGFRPRTYERGGRLAYSLQKRVQAFFHLH